MPFLWTVVAKNGQVFGDPSKGSDARVTNGMRFSYPGYNEILSGFPDPRIDSNDRKPKPERDRARVAERPARLHREGWRRSRRGNCFRGS